MTIYSLVLLSWFFETVSSILSKFQLKKGRLDPGPENVLKLLLWKTQIIKRMTSPQGADCPLPKGGAKGYWSHAVRELTRRSSPESEHLQGAEVRASCRAHPQLPGGSASQCGPCLSLNPPGPETGGGLWGHGALNLDKRFPLLVLESHAGFQIEVFSSNLLKREWRWEKAFPEVQVLRYWLFSHRKGY